MLQFVVGLALLDAALGTTATPPQQNRIVSFNYVSDIRDYEGSAYHIKCEYDASSRDLVIQLNQDGSEALKMLRYQWRTEASVVDDTYHFKSNSSKKVTLSNVPQRARVSIGLVPNPEHEQGGKYWIYIGSTCWTGAKIGKPSKPQIKPTSAFTHPLVEWTSPRNPNGPIDGYDFNWCIQQEDTQPAQAKQESKNVQTRDVSSQKANRRNHEQTASSTTVKSTVGNSTQEDVKTETGSSVTTVIPSTTTTTTASTTTTTTTTTAKPEPKCFSKDIPVNPANVDVFKGYKTTIDSYDPALSYRVCIRAYNWKGTDKVPSEEECQTRRERSYFEKQYFDMCPQ